MSKIFKFLNVLWTPQKKKVFIQEQSDAAVTGYMFKGQKGTKVKLCFVDVTRSLTYSAFCCHKKPRILGRWPVCCYSS